MRVWESRKFGCGVKPLFLLRGIRVCVFLVPAEVPLRASGLVGQVINWFRRRHLYRDVTTLVVTSPIYSTHPPPVGTEEVCVVESSVGPHSTFSESR